MRWTESYLKRQGNMVATLWRQSWDLTRKKKMLKEPQTPCFSIIRGVSKRRFPNIKDFYSWISKKKKKKGNLFIWLHILGRNQGRGTFYPVPPIPNGAVSILGIALPKEAPVGFPSSGKRRFSPALLKDSLQEGGAALVCNVVFSWLLTRGFSWVSSSMPVSGFWFCLVEIHPLLSVMRLKIGFWIPL